MVATDKQHRLHHLEIKAEEHTSLAKKELYFDQKFVTSRFISGSLFIKKVVDKIIVEIVFTYVSKIKIVSLEYKNTIKAIGMNFRKQSC